MDLEILQKRLQEIVSSINQNIANYNMLEGCRKETLMWINKLSNPKSEEENTAQ